MSDEIDFVTEATQLGWVPKEKWTGDPEKWVDAEAFVTKGETVLPILVRNKRELAEQNRKLQADLEQLKKDAENFRKMTVAAAEKEKKELQDQIEALSKQRAKAITDGDGEVVVELEQDIDALKQEQEKLNKQTNEENSSGKVHPDFPAWRAENPWYGTDKKLTRLANSIAVSVAEDNPGVVGKAFFDLVSAEVGKLPQYLERYPEKASRKTNPVETNDDTSPSDSGRSSSTKKDYDSLPPEAKRECERFIKNGWISHIKDVKAQRAAYAKEYYGNL